MPDEIADLEIQIEDDVTDSLTEHQRETHNLSNGWHKEIDLEFEGVNLGNCVQYPMLHTINDSTYAEVAA
jgi:hypothetical protein